MDQQLIKEIITSGSAMLKDFASAAKTTGEHMYGVLVKQQYVEGIGLLVETLVGLITLIVILKVVILPIMKWAKINVAKKSYGGDEYYFFAGLASVLMIGVSMILIYTLGEAIKHILNPEYYAIKFIFEQVRPVN